MNLNQQIKPFTADGIPAYNAKINELIATVNWLMKIRTVNGKLIRDSDQGPVIDLSPVGTTQPAPANPVALPNQQVLIHTSTGQTFPPGTGAFINFDTTDFNTNNAFTVTSSGIAVPANGFYLFGYELQWEWTSSVAPVGNRIAYLYLNGSNYISVASQPAAATLNYFTTCSNVGIAFFNQGNDLSLFGEQNAQGSQTCTAKLWTVRLI